MPEFVQIGNKLFDISDDDAYKSYTLFIVEFEYDMRIMVCHTRRSNTIWQSLRQLVIDLEGSSSRYSAEAKQAFKLSKYLTVTLPTEADLAPLKEDDRPNAMYHLKYELVKKYKSYFPYGYNHLYLDKPCKTELQHVQRCVNSIQQDLSNTEGMALRDLVEREQYKIRQLTGQKRGRKCVPVYQYKYLPDYKQEGRKWQVIRRWTSLIAIREEHPTWQISNISSACADPTRTSYGFKWSHDPDANFN